MSKTVKKNKNNRPTEICNIYLTKISKLHWRNYLSFLYHLTRNTRHTLSGRDDIRQKRYYRHMVTTSSSKVFKFSYSVETLTSNTIYPFLECNNNLKPLERLLLKNRGTCTYSSNQRAIK